MRTCSKCKVEKDLSAFGKRKAKRDWLRSQCKVCDKKYSKLYHEANKEKLRAVKKLYYEINKEKLNAISKLYREANKEKFAKRKSEYQKNNKEGVARRNKKWKLKNQDKVRAGCRRRRAKKKGLNEIYTTYDERYTKDRFNNECFNCGNIDRLHIDHHNPLSKGNALSKTNAVLLCEHCNCSKNDKPPKDFYTTNQLEVLKWLNIKTE